MDEEQIQQFIDQLNTIVEKLQSSEVVSKNTQQFQDVINKIVDLTERVNQQEATPEQGNQLQELLRFSQRLHSQIMAQNQNNEEFLQEFRNLFGDDFGAGSIDSESSENLVASINQLQETINQNNQDSVRRSQVGTGTNRQLRQDFIPEGQPVLRDEQVDRLGEMLSGRNPQRTTQEREQRPDRLGAILTGQNPDQRTRNENQRPDPIGSMLSSSAPREQPNRDTAIRILNESQEREEPGGEITTSPSENFFEEPIEAERENSKKTHSRMDNIHRSIWRGFRDLERIIIQTSQEGNQTRMQAFSNALRRFMRHPWFETMRGLMNGILGSVKIIGKTLTSSLKFLGRQFWRMLFGRTESDTDRIVRSNNQILEFLRTGQVQQKGGGLFGAVRRFRGRSRGEQDLEERAFRGESLSEKEQKRLQKAREKGRLTTSLGRTSGMLRGEITGEEQRLPPQGQLLDRLDNIDQITINQPNKLIVDGIENQFEKNRTIEGSFTRKNPFAEAQKTSRDTSFISTMPQQSFRNTIGGGITPLQERIFKQRTSFSQPASQRASNRQEEYGEREEKRENIGKMTEFLEQIKEFFRTDQQDQQGTGSGGKSNFVRRTLATLGGVLGGSAIAATAKKVLPKLLAPAFLIPLIKPVMIGLMAALGIDWVLKKLMRSDEDRQREIDERAEQRKTLLQQMRSGELTSPGEFATEFEKQTGRAVPQRGPILNEMRKARERTIGTLEQEIPNIPEAVNESQREQNQTRRGGMFAEPTPRSRSQQSEFVPQRLQEQFNEIFPNKLNETNNKLDQTNETLEEHLGEIGKGINRLIQKFSENRDNDDSPLSEMKPEIRDLDIIAATQGLT